MSNGTHVSGTIGALDNNVGVVGVAPGVNLYAARVLANNGSGSTSDIVAGLDWIASTRTDTNLDNDIAVVNASFGGIFGSGAMELAFETLANLGVVTAAAAGNSGGSIPTYPARYDTTISVSALVDSDGQPGGHGDPTSAGLDDTLADFSNYGAEIAAPGVDILSTYKGGGTKVASGTSMAAPHATGAVALFIAEFTSRFGAAQSATLPQDRLDFELVRNGLVATAWNTGDTIADRSGGTLPVLDASGQWVAPPVVQVYSALDEQTLSGTTVIQIDARDVDTAAGGLEVSLIVDGVESVAETSYDPSTGLYEVAFDTTSLSDGTHLFAATASDGTNNARSPDVGTLVDNVNDAPTIAITNPSNNETVSGSVVLTASALDDGGVSTVVFEVLGVSGIVVLDGTESEPGVWTTTWDTTDENGVFSVRATATDDQGLSQFDEVTGITVDQQALQVYVSSDVPKAIKDASVRAGSFLICGETTSTLTISDSRIIQDINVRLDIAHTFDWDLRAHLTSPNGTNVPLFMEVGGDGDNFTDTVLDDEALMSIRDAVAPFTGVYRPGGNVEVNGSLDYHLSDFDGENLRGVWILEINDCGPKDRGTINSWSLEVITNTPPAPLVVADQLPEVVTAAMPLAWKPRHVDAATMEVVQHLRQRDRAIGSDVTYVILPTRTMPTALIPAALVQDASLADEVNWTLDPIDDGLLVALIT